MSSLVRDIKFRVTIKTVEKSLVRHHDGDQQTVTNAFRNRIVIVGRTLNSKVATRSGRSDEGAIPIDIKL